MYSAPDSGMRDDLLESVVFWRVVLTHRAAPPSRAARLFLSTREHFRGMIEKKKRDPVSNYPIDNTAHSDDRFVTQLSRRSDDRARDGMLRYRSADHRSLRSTFQLEAACFESAATGTDSHAAVYSEPDSSFSRALIEHIELVNS